MNSVKFLVKKYDNIFEILRYLKKMLEIWS